MKDLLLKNKFQLFAIGLILALFIFSVFLRQERLQSQIIPDKEWISSHVLITNQIWDENGGPSAYNFSPVYTYGYGSRCIKSMGGLMDENGNYYYVSYPPFAFIFSYYGMKLLGGHSVYNLRALNLILHFFCALLIYLIVYKLSDKNKDHFSVSAVFSAFLYLFSTGTLLIHSIMYFADILVQLFIIYAIYLAIKLFKKEYTSELKILLALGFTFFLAAYTEWMGILLAFYLGCSFLIVYFVNKKRIFLKAFFITGFGATLALATTFIQYSSLNGVDSLVETSAKKYEIRSGRNGADIAEAGYDIHNPDSYSKMEFNFNKHFLMLTNCIGIFSIILLPLIAWKKFRLKMTGIRLKIGILLILLISILTHLILFFNFNAVHDFANLKFGFFVILVIGVLLLFIEHGLNSWLKYVFCAFVLFMAISRGSRDYNRYLNLIDYKNIKFARINSALAMKKYSPPHQMAYSNMKNINPEYIYLAHHNPFTTPDTNNIAFLMDVFEMDTSQYYHHSGDTLKYILQFTWDGEKLKQFDKIDFFTKP